MRVAVINDDTDFLGLMQEVLAEEGYDVDLMRAFDDAHDKVRRSRPDLVILDLVVRYEERGWQLVEMLTLDPKTAAIPLVVCSAAVRALEERREILEAQGIVVIPKPFDLDHLLASIQTALAGRRTAARM